VSTSALLWKGDNQKVPISKAKWPETITKVLDKIRLPAFCTATFALELA